MLLKNYNVLYHASNIKTDSFRSFTVCEVYPVFKGRPFKSIVLKPASSCLFGKLPLSSEDTFLLAVFGTLAGFGIEEFFLAAGSDILVILF